MVKDDYSGAVGGGLKFKGDGVKKKKKKHSSKAKDADKAEALEKVVDKAKEGEEGSDFISLEKNETENELAAEELRELRESRMTESERAFARIKRERVSTNLWMAQLGLRMRS